MNGTASKYMQWAVRMLSGCNVTYIGLLRELNCVAILLDHVRPNNIGTWAVCIKTWEKNSKGFYR